MELRQLECFVVVAEELHFGRAAKRLHLGQPAVTQAVQRFEAAIGGKVFHRTTRSVELTELGAAILPDARRAYRSVERVYTKGRRLSRETRPEVHVGYADDVGLQVLGTVVPALAGEVHLRWRQLGTAAQLEAVQAGTLDAGIGVAPVVDDEWSTLALGTVRLVAVLPVGHPLSAAGTVSFEAITEPILFWPREPNPAFHDLVHGAIVAAGRAEQVDDGNYGLANIASRAAAGDGVGVVPASLASQWHIPGIAYVPFDDATPAAPRLLCWLTANERPGLLRFVEVVRRLVADGQLALG